MSSSGNERPPPWRPAMDRATAMVWARDSVFNRPIFHITERPNVAFIKRRGFDFMSKQFGRIWGNGIYGTDDQDALQFYARFLLDPVPLELCLNVRRVLSVDLSLIHASEQTRDVILRHLANGVQRYGDELRMLLMRNSAIFDEANRRFPVTTSAVPSAQLTQLWRNRAAFLNNRGFVRDPAAEAIVVVLKQDGFEALQIVDVPFRPSVGGSQVVVFNPRQVVVIDE